MKLSKNIFGYFVGICVFLCLIPALIYLISVYFVAPIDSLVAFLLAYIFIFVGVVFMLWSNVYMVRVGKGCPADGFNVSLGERTKRLMVARAFWHFCLLFRRSFALQFLLCYYFPITLLLFCVLNVTFHTLCYNFQCLL